jgi:hypothetical protein
MSSDDVVQVQALSASLPLTSSSTFESLVALSLQQYRPLAFLYKTTALSLQYSTHLRPTGLCQLYKRPTRP